MKIEHNGKIYDVRIEHYRLGEYHNTATVMHKNKRRKIISNGDRDVLSSKDVVFNSDSQSELLYYKIPAFPRGGVTVASCKIGEKPYKGVSICSVFDNFNKKIGRELALNRLFEEIDKIECDRCCGDCCGGSAESEE